MSWCSIRSRFISLLICWCCIIRCRIVTIISRLRLCIFSCLSILFCLSFLCCYLFFQLLLGQFFPLCFPFRLRDWIFSLNYIFPINWINTFKFKLISVCPVIVLLLRKLFTIFSLHTTTPNNITIYRIIRTRLVLLSSIFITFRNHWTSIIKAIFKICNWRSIVKHGFLYSKDWIVRVRYIKGLTLHKILNICTHISCVELLWYFKNSIKLHRPRKAWVNIKFSLILHKHF